MSGQGKQELSKSGSKSQSGTSKSNIGGQKEQFGGQAVNLPEIHPPIVTFSDIDPKYEKFAFEKAEEAFRMMQKGEKKYFKDAAEYIKKQFDEQMSPSWHVIVGKQFGSFVTYEAKTVIYFWINNISFLIFKFG